MKPFLKWVGGKRAILPELISRVPKSFVTYHEPFVGGGALFFELSTRAQTPISAVLSDTNQELIWTYEVVRDGVQQLLQVLRELRASHARPGFFYEARSFFNLERVSPVASKVDVAAMFLYLNKACFNGLMRTNAKGDFNAPRGSYETIDFDEANLLECSKALQETALYCGDFQTTVVTPHPGDFLYADPPYIPIEKTSFVKYGAKVFSMTDQGRLRDYARKLIRDNVTVLLSNSDTPETRDLYKDFEITKVEVPRRINRDGKGRGKVGEVIISEPAFPALSEDEIRETLASGAKAANELHKTLQNLGQLNAESAGLLLGGSSSPKEDENSYGLRECDFFEG